MGDRGKFEQREVHCTVGEPACLFLSFRRWSVLQVDAVVTLLTVQLKVITTGDVVCQLVPFVLYI